MTERVMYELREVEEIEKPYRFYIGNDLEGEFVTREKAEKALYEYVNDKGLVSRGDCLEYDFDEVSIVEVLKIERVEEINDDKRQI